MKASIIVPIYNVEDYLDKCLTSLVNQSEQEIEILCINDGSTDNSLEVIKKFEALDSRVKGFTKENGGLSDARNYGLKLVKSDYVMFIDSDDFCELDMVELCLKHMKQNDADMCVFNVNNYFQETDTYTTTKLPFQEGVKYQLKENKDMLAYCNNAAWNKMYKVSLFTDHQVEYPFGYRHQDLGTTPILLHYAKSVVFIDKPLYNYLADRTNNLTTTYDKKIYHIIDMVEHVVTFYKENDLFDEYQDELKYLASINVIHSLKKLRFYTDKQFIFKFIDDAFDVLSKHFDIKNHKYNPIAEKVDHIYFNKFKLKAYITYNLMKMRFRK